MISLACVQVKPLSHQHSDRQPKLSPSFGFKPKPLSRPLIVIDSGVAHTESLREGAIAGAEVLILDPQKDGIIQITNALKVRDRVTSLHIISHGASGRIDLGKTQLNGENLVVDYAPFLQQWQSLNSAFPLEILLYGCQVAKGIRGRQFIQQFSRLTGAHIAASTSLTGNAALQGNWQLEYRTGHIHSPLALTAEIMADYPGIFVSTVAELITAINNANANDDPTTITLTDNTTFNISAADNNSIAFGATGLPVITSPITIVGNGATIRRSASEDLRFFVVDSTGNLTLENLTLENGRVTNTSQSLGDDGGAILNLGGTLAINDSLITGNFAADDGGAIANIGFGSGLGANLTITNSIISNNTAAGDSNPGQRDDGGGGIENDGNRRSGGVGATVTIIDSEVIGNTATIGSGGGIRTRDGGVLNTNNVMILENSARFGSGLAFGNPENENEEGQTFNIENFFDLANNLSLHPEVTELDIVDPNQLAGNTPFSPPIAPNSFLRSASSSLIPPNSPPPNSPGRDIIIGSTNIPGITGLFPSLLEFTQDSQPPETIPDNTNEKIIDLGTFELGSNPTVTTFKLENIGTSTSEDLELRDFNISPLFTVTPSFLSTDIVDLGFGESTTFDIEFDPVTEGVQSGTIGFNVLKLDTGVKTPFEFILNALVEDTTPTPTPIPTPTPTPTPPPVIPDDNLSVDNSNIFTVGSVGGSNLQVTLQGANTSDIANLKLSRLDNSNQTLSTSVLFSALPDGFRPDGFTATLQGYISGSFNASDRFTIELETLDGEIIGFSPQQLTVTEQGNGVFELTFRNGVRVGIQQTLDSAPLGVGSNQAIDLEVIDLLSGEGTVQANFTAYREALFSNVVGLYKIDDVNGTVGGIAPGESGYARAAIENRVSDLELQVANRSQRSFGVTLERGFLYAPFIIVDSTPANFLSRNPDNNTNGTGEGQAYFLFGAANPDRFDHLLLLGNNTFGFEDLPNGGDRDFNDLIFTVDLA